jgi:hypothetical protein
LKDYIIKVIETVEGEAIVFLRHEKSNSYNHIHIITYSKFVDIVDLFIGKGKFFLYKKNVLLVQAIDSKEIEIMIDQLDEIGDLPEVFS